MSSDADRDGDPLQRPPTGAIRCSLCGRGILRIKEIAKAVIRANVAIVHQRCYDALGPGHGEPEAPRGKARKRHGD